MRLRWETHRETGTQTGERVNINALLTQDPTLGTLDESDACLPR